jgi:TonB family protein
MMDVLVASRPSHLLHPREVLGSSFLHLVMFGVCVAATRVAAPLSIRPVEDTTMVFIPRLVAPTVDRAIPRPGLAGRSGGAGSATNIVIAANPPPRGFQVIQVVGSIPTEIPPVVPGERFLDPRDFTGRGVEGGAGWGVVGGTGPVDRVDIESGVREVLYEAGLADQRFSPAELVATPVFEHPRLLREAGIAGRVVLRFIIDTTGQVEPTSIEVLEKTHEAYATAACTGVLSARFRPAHFGDRTVRQLTRWPVNFQVAMGSRSGGSSR